MSSSRFVDDSLVDEAVRLLSGGDVVALPTETVYGLAANAFNEDAVNRVFQVKGRPLIDPLIVHIGNLDQLDSIAESNLAHVDVLVRAFWPGPLTLILNKKPCISDRVTAGKSTVAVRMPNHPLALDVLKKCNFPVAAPSANPFGYVSPTRAEHVQDSLGDKVSLILDGGPCEKGLESTIVDLTADCPKLLRPGPIDKASLEAVCQAPISVKEAHSDPGRSSGETAPGSLYKHYSPKARLVLVDTETAVEGFVKEAAHGKTAYVSLYRTAQHPELSQRCDSVWLSEKPGDLHEVARQVFHVLRTLDKQGYALIFFEKPPMQGVGLAINDRLKRAAAV